MSAPDFWDESAESVVVHKQPCTAVYTNPDDAVVIRQQSPDFDDDADPYVFIRPENVVAACRAMLREVGLEHLIEGSRPRPLALPAPSDGPKDRTGAERQRRYRASHRNGPTVTRNGVTAKAPSLQFEMEAAE